MVLTELEVQRWVDEALENAARTTKCILEKFASLGVRRHDQDRGEASDFNIADSKAAQTVMRIVGRTVGASSEAGAREEDPRSSDDYGERRPPRDGHPGGQSQRRPPDQARSDVRR